MPTTSRAHLRYPQGTDVPNVAQYIQNLASDVDDLVPPGPVSALYSNGNINISGWSTLPTNATTSPWFSQSITSAVQARGHVHFTCGIKCVSSGTQTGTMTINVGDTLYTQAFTVFYGTTTLVPFSIMTNISAGTSSFSLGVSLAAGPSCAADYAGLRITI